MFFEDIGYHDNNYKNRLTVSICYLLRFVVFISSFIFFGWGNWESATIALIIFVLMILPSIAKERYHFYLPFTLEIGIVFFIFITLFLGHMAEFYDYIPLWDKFAHFQSGILLGITGFILVYIFNENKKMKIDLSPSFVSFFAIAFSLAIGAVWEMVEFVGDSYFNTAWQLNNSDTMWDLIAAGIGSLIVSILGYFWMNLHNRIPFTPKFLSFFRKK